MRDDKNPITRISFDAGADAANADWVRSARLAEKARSGDEDAAQQLKELEETELHEMVWDL